MDKTTLVCLVYFSFVVLVLLCGFLCSKPECPNCKKTMNHAGTDSNRISYYACSHCGWSGSEFEVERETINNNISKIINKGINK